MTGTIPNLKRIINREVRAARERIGTVLSRSEYVNQDGSGGGAPGWEVQVDIGRNRVVTALVKAGTSRERKHAQLGQSVRLRRNAQGRYDVVGPADRLAGVTTRTFYDLDTESVVTASDTGFSFEKVPFEFYQGPTPPTPGTSRWNDGMTPFPFIRIIDADGNPV